MRQPSLRRVQRAIAFMVAVPVVISIGFARLAADERERTPDELQEIVDSLRQQLAIDATVETTIVPANPLLVSVAAVKSPDGPRFRISFEEKFLPAVDDEELKAIVAHELGHVWIFTHHPYLQTERLANTVAMRAVSRGSLAQVYQKVWERTGAKGDLAHFLGQ